MKYLAAFPRQEAFESTRDLLVDLNLPYEILDPEPGFILVGQPALVVDQEARLRLMSSLADGAVLSGWIEYRPSAVAIPRGPSPLFPEDVFGSAAVMVLAPCIADETKVRLIAHISGDMTEALPYLNASMAGVIYNPEIPTLTYMDGYRLITLYPRRIAVAKADDLPDGWRILEGVRCRVNEAFARRGSLTPLSVPREKPTALAIYALLPRTNCGRCGQRTCMAFALGLHGGRLNPFLCRPLFEDPHQGMQDAYREMVARLGYGADDGFN
jgi:ArsR family metal-binding transcriptional regulator